MKTCPNCNYENVDYANNCSQCGQKFNDEQDNNINQNIVETDNIQDNMSNDYSSQVNNTPLQNVPQGNIQQNVPSNYQNNNQQYNNGPSNPYNQHPPQNKKSKIVGLILNMLIVGLGYAYVGKWGEGIVLLVVYIIMFTLGLFLIFPFVIALVLWIYSLIKTNNMIDAYNEGRPY